MIPICLVNGNGQCDQECLDHFLTLPEMPLLDFITFHKHNLETKKKRAIIYADQELRIEYAEKHEYERVRAKKVLGLGDYKILKVLGTGGFSQVLLGNH